MDRLKNIEIKIESICEWIKEFEDKLSSIDYDLVKENNNNIEHNYELILELKDEVEKLNEKLNNIAVIIYVLLRDLAEDKEIIPKLKIRDKF